MSDNLPDTRITKNQYINLYTSSIPPIPVGTQIEVQNLGDGDVTLYSQADSPVNGDTSGKQVIKHGEYMENDEGDLGAWAFSPYCDGLLNVKVAL